MNFDQDKESQQFFDKMHSSRGTRNLQQIFEDDDRPLQSESNNLRYQPTQQKSQTAPTTTKTTATTTTTASSNRNNNKSTTEPKWSTLVAKVANGYNGSESVGRVGVALSRNVVGAAKLVIYKSRSQLLSTLLLTKSTTSSSPGEGASRLLMRASYMQFFDDEQRFWSLRFEAAVDEAEFTDALISLGLPIDQKQPEKAQQNAKEEQQQASTSLAASSTASTAASAAGTPRSFQRFKEFEASSCDSDSESTQSNEENILTLPAPSKALIPVASTTSSAAASSGNKLEAYLHEQRANGEAMDRKMDTLLQAMCRLTAANHSSSNSVVSDSASTLKIESVDDVADNDNEDELLELEQKLLDYKKQNRVLAKSLKQREQEMMVLRASSCALCEKMRNQNNELKKQNRTLIATLADKVKSDDQQDDDDAAGNASCLQCDKYLERIRELEKRVQLLQAVVLDYSKDIKSSSSSNSSGLL
ncbi:uncharacterized protein LOC117573740 [Drosophila albomicans]|uniref:Uncharacterized protein LOC117573740 n=1 Tax=Drosophila albomicans TaxID=7291 RepID=A0A6P8XJM1_DROAB|nr:uncharacterized protein LOC117573740 [Drosophila albomicans]